MITLTLIGIGTGNPDHLTLAAASEIAAADLILIPLKDAGKEDLAGLRRSICDRHAGPRTRIVEFPLPRRDSNDPDYLQAVERWHDAIAVAWQDQITAHLPDLSGRVALLVWGDPALYDSTLRIADRLRLPVIGSPLFIVSGPELVIAQCKAGIIGSFPALNARPSRAA